jgi:hypothetical protein
MRTAPEDVAEQDLIFSVFQGWVCTSSTSRTRRWASAAIIGWPDDTGARRWISVDELNEKRYLGANRDAAFEGLRRAFDTAVALRDSGLEFVLAPTPTAAGETVRRLGAGHTMAVFPYVEGAAHQFGAGLPGAEADQRVEMLVRLHQAILAAASTAPTTGVRLAGHRRSCSARARPHIAMSLGWEQRKRGSP